VNKEAINRITRRGLLSRPVPALSSRYATCWSCPVFTEPATTRKRATVEARLPDHEPDPLLRRGATSPPITLRLSFPGSLVCR
jgi:hypothetical protein